jgi:thiamine biosynthesis lipoprotein
VLIDGQRYGHILNPRTGWPTRGLAGVSVVAETCLLAGSVSTIGMLKDDAEAAWLAGLGLGCLWVDTGGRQGNAGGIFQPALPLP